MCWFDKGIKSVESALKALHGFYSIWMADECHWIEWIITGFLQPTGRFICLLWMLCAMPMPIDNTTKHSPNSNGFHPFVMWNFCVWSVFLSGLKISHLFTWLRRFPNDYVLACSVFSIQSPNRWATCILLEIFHEIHLCALNHNNSSHLLFLGQRALELSQFVLYVCPLPVLLSQ